MIVGIYDTAGDGNFRGYQCKGAEFTTIDYPGAPATGSDAINNSGEIIGIYFDSSDIQHGFTLKNGVYTTIDVPNLYDTEPRGINSKGIIVGDYYDSNDIQHGFIYQNGQFTTVDYPGATNTLLSGINDAGQIVGNYGDGVIVAGNEYQVSNLFFLDQGTFTPLALPVEAQVTLSYTMNGNEFVGFYIDSTGNLFGYEAQIPNGAGLAAANGYVGTVPILLNLLSSGSSPKRLGTENVGSRNGPQMISIGNKSGTPIGLSKPKISGADAADFAETTTCPLAPSTLAPGASCSISVTFTPKATGVRTASLRLKDGVPGSQQLMPLGGTGR